MGLSEKAWLALEAVDGETRRQVMEKPGFPRGSIGNTRIRQWIRPIAPK